jgi:hypothetical protein
MLQCSANEMEARNKIIPRDCFGGDWRIHDKPANAGLSKLNGI